MKPKPRKARQESPKTNKAREKQSGIAIVTVLSVLLLMSVLMLALFSSAKTELETSRYYASSLKTRALTDIVTSIVIGQIREGTAFENRGRIRTTWVSQPGLITKFTDRPARRYEDSVASKHKLYSSRQMLTDARDNLTDDFQNDWHEDPERWVDLNEPVYSDLDQQLYFPIVDPRAASNDTRSNIEGFSYSNTTSAGARIDGVVAPSSNEDKQRLPMPVEWLYILDDGTLGYLDTARRFVPSGSGGAAPSERNPIAARIAFWTDDESCKVNVNTAAEGVPWSTPTFESETDRNFSRYPPAKHEYYRYPGHPAMVSLSSVLYPGQYLDEPQNAEKLKDILDISPRNAWEGSSQGGTALATDRAGVQLDEDRLYTTVDEMLFKASSSPRRPNDSFVTSGSRSPRKMLERGRFFLTANSVAPEMTMFGTPRMSLWPLPENESEWSTFDKLLGFCNKVAGERYYWQRRSAGSRHNEVYGRAGGANLYLLWDYLGPLTNARMPGYGRKLNEKYGNGSGQDTDNFQILTQIWDGVRTSNLSDPMARVRYQDGGTGQPGQAQVASCCLCGGPPSGRNHATDAHRTRWSANGFKGKGIGRLYMASEVTLVFLRSQAVDLPGAPMTPRMEVGVLVETFCPSHGFSKVWPSSYMYILTPDSTGNISQFGAERSPGMRLVGAPEEADMRGTNNTGTIRNIPGASSGGSRNRTDRWWGAHGGPEMFTQRPMQFNIRGDRKIPYRVGDDGKVQVNMTDIWRVIMFDNEQPSINQLIQFADIQWPSSFSIPQPLPAPTNTLQSWESRLRLNDPDQLIQEQHDVTRSMVVGHGDYRLVSTKRWTERGVFRNHHKFTGDTNERHAHSLTRMDGEKYPGASFERDMIQGANYPEELLPDFPNSPSNPSYYGSPISSLHPSTFSIDPQVTGDFDNGIGFHIDGSYVNRLDDGSGGSDNPYFDEDFLSQPRNVSQEALFAPNRLVTGPGQYGSMPTGVRANAPWRTLLFRPDREHYGSKDQPRPGDLPDHLYMDLFWMPVIEPYAISMPFATRGKINLNYQIIPFDNIKRQTALHALMKAERVVAVPTEHGDRYKTKADSSSRGDRRNNEYRQRIDASETLIQAENIFAENQVFRSPTEICELYLVPEGQSIGERSTNNLDYPNMRQFWERHRLTGDNVKERPYANMQPRLTTKSNVFKVHMIVQTIRKVRSTDPDIVDLERDSISGEWRGSAIIERFIDPNHRDIPRYIESRNPTTRTSLDQFYSYRVLHVKQFAP